MKPINTRAHGVLDYLSVGLLCALPRALNWSPRVTNLLTASAAGTLVYSLLTRYELGVVRVLPMKAHLALDAASGASLCLAPLCAPDEPQSVRAALVGLGLFELAVTLSSQSKPFQEG